VLVAAGGGWVLRRSGSGAAPSNTGVAATIQHAIRLFREDTGGFSLLSERRHWQRAARRARSASNGAGWVEVDRRPALQWRRSPMEGP
jgi:hypothetical protein